MNKIYKYALPTLCAALIVPLFWSCDKFLDRQEDETLTFDKIWSTRADTYKYWLTTMSYLPDDVNDFQYSPWLGGTDEGTVAHRDREIHKMILGSWNPSNIPWYQMNRFYQGIRECNIFLQNVDRCEDMYLTEEEKEMWKVQTRFARAYYHFLMMRIYGPIILLGDEILDATAETTERARSSWDECVKYVIDELTATADNPYMYEAPRAEREYGLATKWTCYAVIARLRLYSARDLFNGNTTYASVRNHDGKQLFPQLYDAEKWELAAEAAKLIIDGGAFSLHRDASNDPLRNYYGITQVNWNSELIWTTGIKNRFIISTHTTPTGIGGLAWGGVGPTQQQVDAYAMSNGRYPITGYNWDGSPQIDPESAYPADEMSIAPLNMPNYGAGNGNTAYSLNTVKMFANREARFYVTVHWSGQRWYYGSSNVVSSFAKGGNGYISDAYPHSGYMLSKLYDHREDSKNGNYGSITFPTFRLGEVYLNFIEAALECRKHDVTSAYISQAMTLWAELRDRVGLLPITDVYPGATNDELMELYRSERRVELAFENQRYFDVRTWKIADQTDGGKMWGMNVEANSSGEVTPQDFWQRTAFETRVFKKQHYLYPFSQSEIDRNPLLVQNYGW